MAAFAPSNRTHSSHSQRCEHGNQFSRKAMMLLSAFESSENRYPHQVRQNVIHSTGAKELHDHLLFYLSPLPVGRLNIVPIWIEQKRSVRSTTTICRSAIGFPSKSDCVPGPKFPVAPEPSHKKESCAAGSDTKMPR